jgi:benzodiazapine receptor
MRTAIALVFFLAAAFLAGFIGAQFPPGPWYASLAKPSWNPPDWIFAPVWTLLYLLMGISAWLVWKTAGFAGAKSAMTLFFIQLALNAIWSWLFFGLHMPGAALVEIVLLWLAILATIILFWGVRPTASLLLLPYLAWVAFAAVLNWQIWRLNG